MLVALQKKERYTYADYIGWSNDERWELIHGIARNISPTPGRKHQEILTNLLYFFHGFFTVSKDKLCKVYAAPFDVRLPNENESNEEIDTVVQPDIVVVCDPDKLDEKGCRGAPDLVVEILSPSTAARDMQEKFALYEQHAIREYWVVQPEEKLILIFPLNSNGEFGKPKVYSQEDTATTELFPGLQINLSFLE